MPRVHTRVLALTFGLFAPLAGCLEEVATEPGVETGSIQVSVTTTGEEPDDAYVVFVGEEGRSIDANGTLLFEDLPVGTRSVELQDVAGNCSVDGPNPVDVTVTVGETELAPFSVVCGPGSGTLIEQALAALEDALFATINAQSVSDFDLISFDEAHSLFSQALEQSPTNPTAAFGVAITTIFVLENDPEIRALAEEWEAWLEAENQSPMVRTLMAAPTPLRWERTELPLDLSGTDVRRLVEVGRVAHDITTVSASSHGAPPSVVRHQTVLGDVVLPALESALAAIEQVDDPGFVFTVTERMQGEDPALAEPLELDHTEVLVLRAGLEVAIASIRVATAYVMEPDPLDPDQFVSALTPGSTFLTLAPGGAEGLAEALERLPRAVDILRDALDALEAETDDQTDDIIRYDASGVGDGVTPTDIADARTLLDDLEGALAGPTVVTLFEGGLDEVTFTLDAREFFLDPIPDFKALLPGYEVFTAMHGAETARYLRWTALNVGDWAFPDPTFSGVLPDMASTQDLIDAFGAADLFYELSLASGSYRLITVDGVDCYADFLGGGQGCIVGDDQFYDGSVLLTGEAGAPVVYFDLYGTTTVNASGSWVVGDTGDDTYSVELSMTPQSGGTLDLVGTLVDVPGYTSIDEHFRTRGGSTLTVSYLGSVWVFEWEY